VLQKRNKLLLDKFETKKKKIEYAITKENPCDQRHATKFDFQPPITNGISLEPEDVSLQNKP
jgi:hypothetical protein